MKMDVSLDPLEPVMTSQNDPDVGGTYLRDLGVTDLRHQVTSSSMESTNPEALLDVLAIESLRKRSTTRYPASHSQLSEHELDVFIHSYMSQPVPSVTTSQGAARQETYPREEREHKTDQADKQHPVSQTSPKIETTGHNHTSKDAKSKSPKHKKFAFVRRKSKTESAPSSSNFQRDKSNTTGTLKDTHTKHPTTAQKHILHAAKSPTDQHSVVPNESGYRKASPADTHRRPESHPVVLSVDEPPRNPLFAAAERGDMSPCSPLLTCSQAELTRTRDSGGNTVMHISTAHGHVALLAQLAARAPDLLVERNKARLTPAAVAIRHGHIEALDWLLEHADRELLAGGPRTLLHQAARHGQDGCLRLLLARLESQGTLHLVNDMTGTTPAHLAAKHGHLICLQTLVEYGINVTKENSEGHTPCFLADFANHRMCTGYLMVVDTCYQLAMQLLLGQDTVTKLTHENSILHENIKESFDVSSQLVSALRDNVAAEDRDDMPAHLNGVLHDLLRRIREPAPQGAQPAQLEVYDSRAQDLIRSRFHDCSQRLIVYRTAGLKPDNTSTSPTHNQIETPRIKPISPSASTTSSSLNNLDRPGQRRQIAHMTPNIRSVSSRTETGSRGSSSTRTSEGCTAEDDMDTELRVRFDRVTDHVMGGAVPVTDREYVEEVVSTTPPELSRRPAETVPAAPERASDSAHCYESNDDLDQTHDLNTSSSFVEKH